MTKKLQNTTSKILPAAAIILILAIWHIASVTGMVPSYLLPAPGRVFKTLIEDAPLLLENAKVTVLEAFAGLVIVITQTIPTVAIAPLLVLWFGYELTPKVILVVIVVFFPITVSLLDGFQSADPDTISLMRSMGASKMQD